MATTSTPKYGAAGTMTITLASLASDSTLIAGRQSTTIDNTTTLAIDYMVGGFVTVSSAAAAVGTNKQIEVWAFASYDGTTYSAGAGATDANFSPTGEKTLMRLLTIIPLDTTSSHQYEWGPFSVAQSYGGTMPPKWGVFMVQNSCAALSTSAVNHQVKYTPVNYASS